MHILRFLLGGCDCGETQCISASLSKEYDARLGELQGEEVGTLYIGGGTPSLLSVDEIAGLVSMPVLSADAEVTVEVNPDDVTPDFVDGLKRAGVNV